MKRECEICPKNPEMAESRLHINSFLMGSIFTVLTIIWAFSSDKISDITIFQMVLSIPLVFFASLSYAKVGYNRSNKVWYRFGWITNNVGYLLFLNATGLMVATFSSLIIAFVYFGLLIVLSCVYYTLNIISQPGTLKEHLSKMMIFLIIITLGGIVPILIRF
jgi:hypothetical protein